jgi:hypothetical protein
MARIKAKVMTMGRMAAMLKNVKENKESIETAKKLSPDGKLPVGTLANPHDSKANIDKYINNHIND